ncbi:type II toxin-antitoxin system VapC family toxin [Deinococcus cavernae]|uniref:Type II toxin-antitoxin system VapC family toxin n=1 Tax=Deinococcus cavernae TaxID=2320857 RepID=A0A418V682_9DEIO|nr:type II toxin-antitoxin system VapC family toxin [Deinococcus cavernae]RJF71608.1 type II toxin-antitoxin system VapC family toxin [Deinococcus cavernae]
MTLALDTNILSALFRAEASAEDVLTVLESRAPGQLVIHGAAFSEFLAAPGIDEETAFAFLRDTGVRADWETDENVWRCAAREFRAYAVRRRGSGGYQPRRILADFVIGAHALLRAEALLTLDPQHYRLNFSELKVINPVTR